MKRRHVAQDRAGQLVPMQGIQEPGILNLNHFLRQLVSSTPSLTPFYFYDNQKEVLYIY